MKANEVSKIHKCPQCNGFGKIVTFHGQIVGNCDMCDGEGTIPEEVQVWYSYGQLIKSQRLFHRITLRKAAGLLGIDPSNLSKMERGIIRPHPIDYSSLVKDS